MKKFLLIFVIATLVCASSAAADLQIGVMQNVINTSFLFDMETKYFGFETALGMPLVPVVVSGVEAIFKGNQSEPAPESGLIARGEGDDASEEPKKSSGFSIPAGAMANVYWRIGIGKKFSVRLGVQADLIGIFGADYVWLSTMIGPSLGFNFKFTDTFSMNFTSAIPFAVFSEEVAKYTVFLYSSDQENVVGNIFMAIFGSIGTIGCQLARLSCKWSI